MKNKWLKGFIRFLGLWIVTKLIVVGIHIMTDGMYLLGIPKVEV